MLANNDVPLQIARKGTYLTTVHIFCIVVSAFWFGVVITSLFISSHTKLTCIPPYCSNRLDSSTPLRTTKDIKLFANNSLKKDLRYKLIAKAIHPREQIGKGDPKHIIMLYGNVWNKYDKWTRHDWRKCPPQYSNCRITTDTDRMSRSSAVVYNAADMPLSNHRALSRGSNIKRVFLSGMTPLRTTFDTNDFQDFFDITITHKSSSTIRIPFWPNDGLLPQMYRPKKDTHNLTEEELLDLRDGIKDYFKVSGKDPFLGVTVTNCEDNVFPNLFVRKLQEEGLIHAFALSNNQSCLKRLKDTAVLPCQDELSDACVKHFEQFKYVIIPDDDLCVDFTTRKYWVSIFAWQSVPLLYGAGDYERHLIPNSYIDCVGDEEYISPSFKKSYYPSKDPSEYYKAFHMWRHEDRVEKFYWQCELCRELYDEKKERPKVDMNVFWNPDKDCGTATQVHELMRLQLVRTGVIR